MYTLDSLMRVSDVDVLLNLIRAQHQMPYSVNDFVVLYYSEMRDVRFIYFFFNENLVESPRSIELLNKVKLDRIIICTHTK